MMYILDIYSKKEIHTYELDEKQLCDILGKVSGLCKIEVSDITTIKIKKKHH